MMYNIIQFLIETVISISSEKSELNKEMNIMSVALRARVLASLQSIAEEGALTQRRMQGDEHTRNLLNDMLPMIATFASDPEYRDSLPTYRRTRLIPLGRIPRDSFVTGDIVCQRSLYVGEDARVYVEGPRPYRGTMALDIHPYCSDDAKGRGGLSAVVIAEMAVAYFI